MIKLRNDVIRKEMSENENPKKVINILEKIFNFNNHKNEGGSKYSKTPKQMLPRLPIALEQVKAGSTTENLLNKIRQIIYPLYQAKDITI